MQVLVILAANSFAIVCAIAAAALLFNNREGWGWFLFVAFLAAGSATALVTNILGNLS